jgi:hypothetical protein
VFFFLSSVVVVNFLAEFLCRVVSALRLELSASHSAQKVEKLSSTNIRALTYSDHQHPPLIDTMNAFEFMRAGAAAKKNIPAADPSSSQPPAALPWIEKYRPKSIESVQGQEGTTKILAKALNRADVSRTSFLISIAMRLEWKPTSLY